MTRWMAFAMLAFVISPLLGLVAAVGLTLASGDVSAVVVLFVLPALATLLAAVRTKRPNWVIAVTRLLSGVLGLMAGVVVAVFFTARPFD